MGVYRLVWADVTKNRDVEIHVNYRLADGVVQIEKLTPTKVTLYQADGKTVDRVLPVTRPTGQRLLTQAYENSRTGEDRLEDQIREQHLAV